MAGVYIIKLMFIVFVLCAFSNRSDAQTTIRLQNYPGWQKKTYNLSGSELYLIVNNDTLFVPKISPFEFRTNRAIDSLMCKVDSLSSIIVLIRNRNGAYYIPLPAHIYHTQDHIGISVFKNNRKILYDISFLNTCGDGYCTSNLVIQPNRLWKRKYLK